MDELITLPLSFVLSLIKLVNFSKICSAIVHVYKLWNLYVECITCSQIKILHLNNWHIQFVSKVPFV